MMVVSVAPTNTPDNLVISDTTFTSIAVAWDEVPCQDRNIEITNYQWRLNLTTDSTVSMGGSVDSTTRSRNFTGLIPRNSYTIEVRAFHLNFNAVPPVSLSGPAAVITTVTAVPPGNPPLPLPPLLCPVLVLCVLL